MATISTSLRLTDNMSSVLSRVIQAMNRTAGAAQDVRTQVDRMGSSSGTDRMRQSVERTSTAFQNTAKQIQNCTNHQNNFITKLREGATAADGLWDKIKGVAATYLSLQGIKQVMSLSDDLTTATARIDRINDGSQTTAQLMDKIYQSAERTRSSYIGMADSIADMKSATGDLFKNNSELMKFNESLHAMFAVNGVDDNYAQMATTQLTQALSVGALRGQDYHSVASEAPVIKTALAQYMGVKEDALKAMADEGQLSSTVVKNAILSYYSTAMKQLNEMPMTFAQVWTLFKNYALQAFQPVLQKIGQLTKTEQFQNFVNQAAQLVGQLANVALQAFDVIMQVTDFIAQNWNTIGPVLEGIVTGLLAWKAAQALVNAVTKANPVVIIFAAAAGVIGYLIGKVGGLSNALTLLSMGIQLVGSYFQLFGMQVYHIFATATGYVEDFCIEAFVNTQKLGRDIENFFLGVYISVAKGFQDFLNWFVDRLNDVIGLLNKIPGVNIEQVGRLHFGEDDEKWANQRISKNNEWIDSLEGAANNLKTTHTMEYYQRTGDIYNQGEKIADQASKIAETYNKMKDETEKASKEKTPNYVFGNFPADYSNVVVPKFDPSMLGGDDDDKKARKSTAKNTKKTADSVSKLEQDLSWMRQLAEREVIQRITTLNPNVNTTVYVQKLDTDRDLDGLASQLNDVLFEQMRVSAEGIHSV